MSVVRAALVQTSWTGDKESMIVAHEDYAREAAAAGRAGHLLPGAVLRAVLLPGAGRRLLRVRRGGARPDRRALPGSRARAAPRHGAADVRAGAARLPLQHRGRDRRRRQLPRQVPQAPHPAREAGSGRSSTSAPATSASPCSTRRSARSASTSATTGTSRRAGVRSASTVRRSCSTRRPPRAGCRRTSGSSSSRPLRSPTSTSSARSTASASRTWGDDDFYGTSYFVDPQGQFVGEVADSHSPELVIRDLDLELLTEVRNRWAFYRDRRPEAYGDLVQP